MRKKRVWDEQKNENKNVGHETSSRGGIRGWKWLRKQRNHTRNYANSSFIN